MSKLTKRDNAELVARVVPRLTAHLDRDLWKPQPGRAERFDVDRFGEWLEDLVEAGESLAADIIAALDRNLVVAGLSRYLRVFDPGIFEPVAQSDDERIDRHEAMREGDAVMTRDVDGDRPACEVGGYIIRARRSDAWDAIIALLLELYAEHPESFHALMQGCRALSNSRPEIGGTDDLLMAPEQHLYDVAVERDRRRAHQGFATAADARAFLKLARMPKARDHAPIGATAIVADYFRAQVTEQTVPSFGANDDNTPADELMQLLTGDESAPDPPRALLGAAEEDPQPERLAFLKRLMTSALERDESAYLSRSGELAFLANVLLSGCSVQSRPFTPREASDAAASICNLGLECWPESASDDFLVDHDLVPAFELGWSVLYRDVSLFAADQLITTLQALRVDDAETRFGLHALQRRLLKERDAGTPWLARGAADVLSMLDVTASVAVTGLLDECPILPEVLTAIINARTSAVDANAFEFISTAAQIGDVRIFMRMLPVVLLR